jgi:NAD(P)H-hydrate epimerase
VLARDSRDNTYTQKTLSAKSAAALDEELMSRGAFSIDQLMELAGLSVSQAGMQLVFHITMGSSLLLATNFTLVFKLQPLNRGKRILVACGPGNNGMC